MYTTTRKDLIEIARLVYDRGLTNAAGSNFSGRASANALYVSPTGNAKRNRLRMSPDDFLLVDFDGNIIEGQGELSRSWNTHRGLYRAFEYVGAVIHAHPKLATVFACREEPMLPFLDAMKKYGQIPVVKPELTIDSPEFVEEIVNIFRDNEISLRKHGFGVLYAYHGVLVAGPTLDDAFDLLERIEYNATAILYSKLLN